jgi:hypothetical protein
MNTIAYIRFHREDPLDDGRFHGPVAEQARRRLSRVVGGWAQGRTAEIVYRPLVDIGREGCDAVTAAADGIAAWPWCGG